MSLAHHRLELPDSLQTQLYEFRRRVWTVKIIEALCGAVFGILMAFLTTFVLDRVFDTSAGLRLGIFVAAMLGCALVPLALHRWVWRHRSLEQLARLLSRKHPSIGDQLLGIIELVRNDDEQARSRALCEAAIRQVSEQALKRNFADAVPNPKHHRWGMLAALAGFAAVGLLAWSPAAWTNAWVRFLAPWGNTARYTFTMVDTLPDRLVVAHGEPFTFAVSLTEKTVSRPNGGVVRLGQQPSVSARLNDGRYEFELPAQIEANELDVRVGDFIKRLRVEPMLRPELTSVVAEVALPDYLGRAQALKKDVRGGTISLVKGSRATFVATASRDLSLAQVDGQIATPVGKTVSSPALEVDESRTLVFEWRDQFGLVSKEPFNLAITGREDEAPSMGVENLPRQKVVLDSEQLTFQVRATDDFGVKRVGIEWQGMDKTTVKSPAHGERILAAGATDKEVLELAGTFSATSLSIEPQPVQVRLFAEDFFPGRERTYSPTYTLYVLNAEQHAIWLTEQLSKWHRQSLEVRDREMALHETNKQLREMSSDELNQPDTRKKIDQQSAAERANGRRLTNLVANGEELVKQAMRNPEFGVGHLEKWADMLQILKDISGTRMPSVADLLKQAAQSPSVAQNSPGEGKKEADKAPMAGQVRASASGKPGEGKDDDKKKPNNVPAIVDVESTQQPNKPDENQQAAAESKKGSPSLGLPGTTLIGNGKKGNESCPAGEKVDEAVKQQQDLLAEFEKITDELNRVLANLEGSTLVKRLKAASRLQNKIAGRVGDQVSDAFGVANTSVKPPQQKLLEELSGQESKSSQDVSNIMDDMQGYFERRRFMQFKTVLDEMREQDVIGALRLLSDDLKKESGVSMAQCEFWSDSMDRWAEDLVDPTSGGT